MSVHFMPDTVTQRCFLLTHHFRDTRSHFEIDLFGSNEQRQPVHIRITDFRPLFFISAGTPQEVTHTAAERKPLTMKTFSGTGVDCLYFTTLAAMQRCAESLRAAGHPVYETDVHPVDRFLMERSVFGGFEATGPVQHTGNMLRMVNPRIRGGEIKPHLSVLSLDIETHVATGELYSIACSGVAEIVFIIGQGNSTPNLVFCENENVLLQRFIRHILSEDPDIVIGWNVIEFDLAVLYRRCQAHNLPFAIGRDNGNATVFMAQGTNRTVVRIDGRCIMDLPFMLRTYYHPFEEYSLNHVASRLLGREKEIVLTGREKIAEIDRLYHSDPVAFARYNLIDTRLTKDIFQKTGILENAMAYSERSGHLPDRTGGSIAAFDYLYLPRLHRAGYVAPDAADAAHTEVLLPGGYVLEPQPGIYENVLVLDFRSLYPSIILSFAIDPLGMHLHDSDPLQGPVGPPFARSPALLPYIISELLDARAEAKNNGNPHLSQAIKILMNSFYGVLGARNCRFFSIDIASTITQTGQYLLKKTIEYIEQELSHDVIYGDTDSLFIHLGKGAETHALPTGKHIAATVTHWLRDHLSTSFNATSALLLQFENHFRYLLIPKVRGASHGSKKHYCGATLSDDTLRLHFKGMESARSDWTDLAKEFQRELITRIFSGTDVETYIITTVALVKKGIYDRKLIYKKRLRKKIGEYTQQIPPHVQAARLLEDPPAVIRYYITSNGPQPVENRTAPIDHQHYIDCQLQPVADSVLELVGKSFTEIISGQQDLFGGTLITS
jgi:DNA polymerase II